MYPLAQENGSLKQLPGRTKEQNIGGVVTARKLGILLESTQNPKNPSRWKTSDSRAVNPIPPGESHDLGVCRSKLQPLTAAYFMKGWLGPMVHVMILNSGCT